jgi:predicted ATPase
MFSITLTNFRSFKNQTFDFDKFNILIGENSSGKSSLFKFLLALKQSLQAPANREINMLFSGEYVDLGSYKESIYYHDDSLPLAFKFSFREAYLNYFYDFMLEDENRPSSKAFKWLNEILGDQINDSSTEITLELSKDLYIHDSIKTNIKNTSFGELVFEYGKGEIKGSKSGILEPKCNIKYLDFEEGTVYELKGLGYSKDAFMTIIDGTDLRTSCRKIFGLNGIDMREVPKLERKKIAEKVDKLYNRVAYLLVVQNFLRSTIDRLEYINPINTHLLRYNITKDQRKFTSINDLDDVLAFFANMDTKKEKIFKEYKKILKKLGVAEDLKIIADERLPITELRVKVKDLMSNISDVGYGVSLQLPIILKALLADQMNDGVRKYILIEQPEVHLHPKLHASLVDALLLLSKNTSYFIETHSEHIVRKLQVAVKEKTAGVKPENITVHYLIRENRQSKVSSHKILESGLFEEILPTGFFDNSFILSKQLM